LGRVQEVLVALVVFTVTMVLLCFTAFGYTTWRVRKQLRVRPSVRSVAPTYWLMATTEPARLHRRLRKASTVARAAGERGGPTIAELADDLQDHAVALEHHLVLLSRVWRRERVARREIVDQVAQLEGLSSRLTISAMEVSRPRALSSGSPDALAELTERINTLDAAREELTALERTWNLN
jgi:hypothetical protein